MQSPIQKKKVKGSAGKKLAKPPPEAVTLKPPAITPEMVMKRHRTMHKCKEFKAVLLNEG